MLGDVTPLDPWERRGELDQALLLLALVVAPESTRHHLGEHLRAPALRHHGRSAPRRGHMVRRTVRPPRSC